MICKLCQGLERIRVWFVRDGRAYRVLDRPYETRCPCVGGR